MPTSTNEILVEVWQQVMNRAGRVIDEIFVETRWISIDHEEEEGFSFVPFDRTMITFP